MTDADYEMKEAYLERLLGRGVESLPFSVGCEYCRSGLVPGDWVPYGSTMAQRPDTVCECVYEHGMVWVDQTLADGDLSMQELRG